MAVLNFRTDPPSEQALAELTADGRSTSDVIRQALVDTARLRRRELLHAASLEAANDPGDLAESRRVRAELDQLGAW